MGCAAHWACLTQELNWEMLLSQKLLNASVSSFLFYFVFGSTSDLGFLDERWYLIKSMLLVLVPSISDNR